jgi:hypothetical protein
MINLGDKKWGVKDSGLLAYKQVGSKLFNKDFDFTRSSDATYIDKNGVLQTQSLYNLLPYSNVFNTWTFDDVTRTDGHIGYNGFSNAWLIQYNTTASRHNINRSVSFSGSGTFSVYAKAKELQYIQIASAQTTEEYANFDLSDGSIGNVGNRFTNVQAIPVGNDWYRLSVTTANGYNFIYISIVTSKTAVWLESFSGANSTDGLYIQDAQLVEGTEPLDYQYTNGRVGIPRIDFTDANGALLLEPQRTNNFTQSESFANYYVNRATATDLGTPSIFSSGSVARFTANNFAAYFGKVMGGITSGITYSVSGFFDLSEGIYAGISDATNYRIFNLLTASVVGSGALTISCKSTQVGSSNYYRVSFTFTATTTGNHFFVIGKSDGTINTINEKVAAGYFQREDSAAYATSYIPTQGSTTTRTADVANNCGTEQDFNSEEGVLYFEGSALADGTNQRWISLGSGSNANRVSILFNATSRINCSVRASSSAVYDAFFNIGSQTNHTKAAIRYKNNDFAFFVNGVKVNSQLSGTLSFNSPLSELAFDSADSGSPFYGKVRSVKYFPTALGDSKLITLTSGDGSLYGLFNSFKARVLADGGTIESQDCIINELKELL